MKVKEILAQLTDKQRKRLILHLSFARSPAKVLINGKVVEFKEIRRRLM